MQHKMKRLGFLVNPIAGMGGAVGLKGTDGEAYIEALKLGANPVTPERAKVFLSSIKNKRDLFIISAPGPMGENQVKEFDIEYYTVGSLEDGATTSAVDTKRIVEEVMKENIDLLVFVGGDGTSRDVFDVVGSMKPVLGVPSGVKMFGSVFAVNAESAAKVVDAFVEGNVEIVEKEVLDINEEAFRKSKLDVKLYGYMKVPTVRDLVQAGKEPSRPRESQMENQRAIAKRIVEDIDEKVLYLLGPGTTTRTITDELGVNKTLLGVDAVYDGKLVGEDINESEILSLVEKFDKARIIVSPIGGQGFIFGRGNQEFSPDVIKSVGKENIIVVATRDKVDKLSCLRVDTGKAEVDETLKGYIKVIIDYREWRLIKVE
jgi:predicted polyphosphate/ATP-dependent NAD kinase